VYIAVPVLSVFLLSSLFFFLWSVVILVTPRCCWSDRELALILLVDLSGPGSVCRHGCVCSNGRVASCVLAIQKTNVTGSMPQISQLVLLRCVSAERRAHNL